MAGGHGRPAPPPFEAAALAPMVRLFAGHWKAAVKPECERCASVHEHPPSAVNISSPESAPGDPLADVAAIPATARTGSRHTLGLMLGAMGVVFGDIGTSPLYALKATVLATEGGLANHVAVMGSLSMIFWALILVVTVKYVLIIMRADNDGEGGTLALAALAHRSPGMTRRIKATIGIGAIVGLALFFGDGMLTPAVTVLSAVEGLKVENN